MDWSVIIEMFLDAIMESLENRSPREIAARLKKPGGWEWVRLRRLLVKELGLKGRALRDACKECMAELKSLPGSEIDALVADAAAMRAEQQDSE